MAAEKQLQRLLAQMHPVLDERTFVFAHLADEQELPQGLTVQMWFREAEGPSLIIEQQLAERHGIDYEFECRMITLKVHSALDAVGFLARVTHCLAEQGMGVNPVAGFFHDHLFVPADKARSAMQALNELSAQYR